MESKEIQKALKAIGKRNRDISKELGVRENAVSTAISKRKRYYPIAIYISTLLGKPFLEVWPEYTAINDLNTQFRLKGLTHKKIALILNTTPHKIKLVVNNKAKSYPIAISIAKILEKPFEELWPNYGEPSVSDLIEIANTSPEAIANELDVKVYSVKQVIEGKKRSRKIAEYIAELVDKPFKDLWPDYPDYFAKVPRKPFEEMQPDPEELRLLGLIEMAGSSVRAIANDLDIQQIDFVRRVIDGRKRSYRVAEYIAKLVDKPFEEVWPSYVNEPVHSQHTLSK